MAKSDWYKNMSVYQIWPRSFCDGNGDGIVVPNLATGNVMVKVLQHNAGATGCGVLVGAKIPVAITSRSDAPEQAFYSLAACAAMWDAPAYKKIFD